MIRIGRLAPLVIALALVLVDAGPAPAQAPAKPPAAKAPAAKPAASTARRSMPDSVLARVGASRTVTVSEFRRAWDVLEPPVRPDSLTPEGARQFLDLLVEKEVLAEAAMREKWTWTAVDTAQYIALRDQLMLKMALDSALTDMRRRREAAGDSVLGEAALGVVVRESTVAGMNVRFEDAAVEKMRAALQALPRPSRDSSLFAQIRVMGALPVVDPKDSVLVLARSTEGPYLVRDLLLGWKSLNPLSRPRIETASHVHDLVRNGLYERRLRNEATRRRLDLHPAIASELAERREYLAVSQYVEREVYSKLMADTTLMRKFYEDHVEEYRLPDRVGLIRIVLPNRAEAGRMGARLMNEAEAETLAARARRERLSYRAEITERSDSTLFRAAHKAGVGAVLGPDSVKSGWQVARVTGLHPSRLRSYEEVADGVTQHYANVEGERRMRELIDRLRKQTSVNLNAVALAKLAG